VSIEFQDMLKKHFLFFSKILLYTVMSKTVQEWSIAKILVLVLIGNTRHWHILNIEHIMPECLLFMNGHCFCLFRSYGGCIILYLCNQNLLPLTFVSFTSASNWNVYLVKIDSDLLKDHVFFWYYSFLQHKTNPLLNVTLST
jgi:hypothetical protein